MRNTYQELSLIGTRGLTKLINTKPLETSELARISLPGLRIAITGYLQSGFHHADECYGTPRSPEVCT